MITSLLRPTSVLLLLLFTSLPAGAEEATIGVVDLQRALVTTQEGIRAQAVLRRIHEQFQRELDQRQDQLREIQGQLQLPGITQTERRELEEQYRVKYTELTELYTQFQRELEHREQQMVRPMTRRLQEIVENVRRERQLTVVLETSSGVVVGRDPQATVDVTDEVVRRYNQRWP